LPNAVHQSMRREEVVAGDAWKALQTAEYSLSVSPSDTYPKIMWFSLNSTKW